MNILHNAEAAFAIAVGFTVGAGAMLPSHYTDSASAAGVPVSVATPNRMAIVTVSARRLTVVEKMRSLEDERALARAAIAPQG